MRFDYFYIDSFVIIIYVLVYLHQLYSDAFVGELLVRK